MQSRGHAPHGVVTHNASQAEGGDHLGEGCVGRDDAQGQTGGHTYRETGQRCRNAGKLGLFLLVSLFLSKLLRQRKMCLLSCLFSVSFCTIKALE